MGGFMTDARVFNLTVGFILLGMAVIVTCLTMAGADSREVKMKKIKSRWWLFAVPVIGLIVSW